MYLATFHTHFGAMSFRNKLQKSGDKPQMMPVPRALSASCGVCIRFALPFDPAWADDDLECVYEETGGSYRMLFCNEE